MAVISKGITLSYKQGEAAEYTKLTNLLEIPEMGNSSSRERIDVTTLDDDKKKSVPGLMEEAETELSFNFLYEKEQFMTLAAIAESVEWQVAFPDGLTATFAGIPSIMSDGAGVSAAVTYTLNISIEGEIAFA